MGVLMEIPQVESKPKKISLTGQSLKEALNEIPPERKPLIDGFLYERSVLMLSADPGAGKSTITAQAIAQMSCGLPVFGCLNVPRPIKCYYLSFERGREEILERLKVMQDIIPMDFNNIFINDSFIGYNVLDIHHANTIITCIESDCIFPDIVILDPIYSAVAGGLSTDEKASQFTRFSARLQSELGCTNWLNHHTTKETYANDGTVIEKADPFYGSQWLKAHCTAAYYLKRKDGGSMLLNKKDSQNNLIKRIYLEYNPEEYISFIDQKNMEIPAIDRLKTFLRTKWKSDNKTFYYDQLESCLQPLSTARLRVLCRQVWFQECVTISKSSGKKSLYEVIKDI
jgi:RecA-family ATPase